MRELHESSNAFTLAPVEQWFLCDRWIEMHDSLRIHSRSNFVDDIPRDTHGILTQCHDVLHTEGTLQAACVSPALMANKDVTRKERRKSTTRPDPRQNNGKTLIPEIRLRP